jgi:hypothetical protein
MENVFALLTAVAVAFGPLAIGVTKLVDGVRNVMPGGPKWLWNVLAFVIGILVCVLFEIDVVAALAAQVPAFADKTLDPFVSQLITGLGVGGTASYWHERMDLASSRAKGTATK